jgi:hypothetical protein
MRFASGKSIDCHRIGSDTIHFKTVGSFDAVGASMSHGRTDRAMATRMAGPAASVFSGNYAFGDWVNQDLQVSWGVFRSHTSPRTYIDFNGTVWSDPFYGSFSAAVFVEAPPVGVGEAIRQIGEFSPIHSRDSYDECESGWVLAALTVWGPAGVAP